MTKIEQISFFMIIFITVCLIIAIVATGKAIKELKDNQEDIFQIQGIIAETVEMDIKNLQKLVDKLMNNNNKEIFLDTQRTMI